MSLGSRHDPPWGSTQPPGPPLLPQPGYVSTSTPSTLGAKWLPCAPGEGLQLIAEAMLLEKQFSFLAVELEGARCCLESQIPDLLPPRAPPGPASAHCR